MHAIAAPPPGLISAVQKLFLLIRLHLFLIHFKFHQHNMSALLGPRAAYLSLGRGVALPLIWPADCVFIGFFCLALYCFVWDFALFCCYWGVEFSYAFSIGLSRRDPWYFLVVQILNYICINNYGTPHIIHLHVPLSESKWRGECISSLLLTVH